MPAAGVAVDSAILTDQQGAAVLSDPGTRQALTPATIGAMVKLAEHWRLGSATICALLGDIPERSWFRMKRGDWTEALSMEVLTRASGLIGIYKALHLVFSDPLADEWVSLPNQGALFVGRTPLDWMIAGGLAAIRDTRRHVDALRGGV